MNSVSIGPMTCSVVDSAYYGDMFASAAMRAAFSDQRRFESWLDVEVALARAEERVGVIPGSVASRIAAAAKIENLDLAAMKAEYERVGFPILPLVHQLAKACDPESARWVHWGATTQDIVDTGLVLQMREGLGLISEDLDQIIESAAALCRAHRDTVMAGRTFQQQAAPITFGFKAAVWLDELLRHRDRLAELKPRVLIGQFGGAVGTLSTLGHDGLKVLDEFCRELGLGLPRITWHTARDGWAELVFWLAMLCSTLSKIASEVADLMRTEIDEVREPFAPGRGGSTAMPQKRNPISCPIIIAIGHRLRDSVSSQLTAMVQEHERAVATQPLEWLVIPEAFVLASGSLKHSKTLLSGLTVNAETMRRNLALGGGLLMSEAVMMGLAPRIGRGQAHDLVSRAAGRATDQGKTLREALANDHEIMSHLTAEELDRLLDPANYLGVAGQMVDAVLERLRGATDGRGSGGDHG